jgi:hypothetical protein
VAKIVGLAWGFNPIPAPRCCGPRRPPDEAARRRLIKFAIAADAPQGSRIAHDHRLRIKRDRLRLTVVDKTGEPDRPALGYKVRAAGVCAVVMVSNS